MNDFITLIDPSIRDHKGNNSINLGDVIIYESISRYLNELFPHKNIVRISSHTLLEKKHFDILKIDNLKFFGGTNVLSSDLRKYHQWKLSENFFFPLNPSFKNLILFGVGWWQYQHNPTFATKYFYNRVLSKRFSHSIRDGYTKNKMIGMGFTNSLNTSCPTTWELHGMNGNRKDILVNNCLFSLTDYAPNSEHDNKLLEIILEYYSGEIFFYPQGTMDIDYINSLEVFKVNRNRITIINRSGEEFKKCIDRKDINFIGTRLHGGIKCLQNRLDSVIISIDNRAKEIGTDINLPVIERGDYGLLRKWLNGENIFPNINLPLENINKWKDQFKNN